MKKHVLMFITSIVLANNTLKASDNDLNNGDSNSKTSSLYLHLINERTRLTQMILRAQTPAEKEHYGNLLRGVDTRLDQLDQ